MTRVVQLALLAKAVLVALFGADLLLPGRHGKSGLLFMFAAVVTSLICLFVEMLSACALISGDRNPSPGTSPRMRMLHAMHGWCSLNILRQKIADPISRIWGSALEAEVLSVMRLIRLGGGRGRRRG